MSTQMSLRLPFTASSVPLARRSLRDWLSVNVDSRDAVEDARVVISELVGNSVRHARPLADGSLIVAWCLDEDGVQLSVTDGGAATNPRRVRAPSSALAGRGMAIVDVLSERWWTEQSPSRSTVHAVITTAPAHPA